MKSYLTESITIQPLDCTQIFLMSGPLGYIDKVLNSEPPYHYRLNKNGK